jgi:hypothetical protein
MMAASCTNRGVSVLLEILSRTRKHEREGVKDPSRPYGVKLWPRCILYILLMHHHVLCSQMLKTNVVKVMQYYSFLNIISFHMYNSRCNIFFKIFVNCMTFRKLWFTKCFYCTKSWAHNMSSVLRYLTY